MAKFQLRGLSRAAIPLVTTAAVVLTLSACAESGQRYVKNSDDGVYFKIPNDWQLYDEDAVVGVLAGQLSPQQEDTLKDIGWQVGFDAAPEPSVDHLADLVTDHPAGLARVQELAPEERDVASLEYLRNIVIPVDQLGQQDESAVDVLEGEPISESGFHGLRLKFNVRDPEGNKFVTFHQVALVDNDLDRVFLFVVSCEAHCYEDDEGTLDDVVESWTVKET